MKKQVIFNVGGALSSYIEVDDRRVVIDLGKGSVFSPVNDFLLPLAQRRSFLQHEEKYVMDQLFLSHLDNDHISDVESLDEHFHPFYWTAPNDNPKQNNHFHVNPDRVKNPGYDYSEYVLQKMRPLHPGRSEFDQNGPSCPLVSAHPDMISLYYIPPQICETHQNLDLCNYANNISLVLFINIDGHTTLMPGDIMPDGMAHLLDTCANLTHQMNTLGVDFLLTPHHGLSSTFSTRLFQSMRGGKTRRLNIISEKTRFADSDESRTPVDSRYYSNEYSCADNNLNLYATKTSNGHIVIDYSFPIPQIKICSNYELIKEFGG